MVIQEKPKWTKCYSTILHQICKCSLALICRIVRTQDFSKKLNDPKKYIQNLYNLLQNESQEFKDNFSTGDNCKGTLCLFPSISLCKREEIQKRA